MFEFLHKPPKGYSYEFENFRSNVVRIWIVNNGFFSYTDKQPKSIWGFYNVRKKTFHAPIRSDKVGDVVNFSDTTPYSAMQILRPMRPSVLSFV